MGIKRRCVILSAAPVENPGALRRFLREDDYIIAADAGLQLANRLGIKADCLVADFDSLKEQPGGGIPVYRLPVRKDDTDTMAAARIGLQEGFKDFLLLGASGGRLDHTFANFSVMLYLIKNGAKAVLADDKNIVQMVLPGTILLEPVENAKFSLMPFGGVVSGLTVKNAGYEVCDYVLTPDFPVGVSNEFIGRVVEISFKDGILLIFISID
ncbi:MAG TPA: thiamine diphosphokinase [Candidatus Avimonas sp.]|nr:thiamine diphosphokinase [Clostridiales bacterium]HPU58232.1 thiamine diphosphokinase [Candidatus Avimonas sp.]